MIDLCGLALLVCFDQDKKKVHFQHISSKRRLKQQTREEADRVCRCGKLLAYSGIIC